MNYNFLTFLGLNDKESEVYILLVKCGPISISDIVSRTKLHRPYAYRTIGSLLEKGLVTRGSSGSKKVFIPLSPEALKKRAQKIYEETHTSIDLLSEEYNAPHLETVIKTVQGKSGITSIFSDLVESLKKGDIFYRYTSETDTEYVNKFLPKDYRAIRDKKQLERFVISNWSSALNKQKRLERATKVIPKNESSFNQDCIQLIYGNKVAFIDINQLQGVIIENKNLAQFQREIFKLLYKRI